MKQILDIRDLNAELDADDRELMKMFPRSREAAVSDMLLVRQGGSMYLVKKSEVARKKKIADGIAWAVLASVGVLFLVLAVSSWMGGNRIWPLFLTLFEAVMLFCFLKSQAFRKIRRA